MTFDSSLRELSISEDTVDFDFFYGWVPVSKQLRLTNSPCLFIFNGANVLVLLLCFGPVLLFLFVRSRLAGQHFSQLFTEKKGGQPNNN